MRLTGKLLWLVLFSLAPAPLAAESSPSPESLLLQMAGAAASVSFHGLLVYGQSDRLDAMEVVRAAEHGQERVYSLTGQPREMVRQDHETRWVLPRERTVLVDRAQRRQRPGGISREQVAELPRWYRLKVRGTDRVAGRVSRVLYLEPQDAYRYGYRLWLDKETGLLLRSECRDQDSRVLEHFMYVQLELDGGDVSSALRARIPDSGFRVVDSGTANIDDPDERWLARDLPPGFRLLEANRRKPPGAEESVLHYLYGDGLAAVSVYITQAPKHELEGYAERGNTRMAGRTVAGHHVTVVGEVPRVTVERILDGIGVTEAQ